MRALLIPHDSSQPVGALDVPAVEALDVLQRAVGGFIEALPLPSHVDADRVATAYVNEEGKLTGLPLNGRATDLLLPGAGLLPGDWIAGNLVIVGFDPGTGEHRDLPDRVGRHVQLIALEAA